jgi:flagellar basal body-associated protein FliL
MTESNSTPGPAPSGRKPARLRTIGLLILLLGLAAAAVVYWTGAPPPSYADDPDTARAYKTESRNLEINFGKLGLLANDLLTELQHPGAQALLIATVSILAAAGCFYVARLMERDDRSNDPAS